MLENKVLLVEDEQAIRELMHLYFVNRGYLASQAEDGNQALQLLLLEKPHLVLLDIELPDADGFTVCQKIRKVSDVPIIFVSSRKSIQDRVKGFELGGDDFVTKPFDFEELEMRVKASLGRYKRVEKSNNDNLLTYGNLDINVETYECYVNDEIVPLSTKEMQILIFLAKHPKQVFSAEQLYDQIWGFESAGDIQTVKVHIRNLRGKIEDNPTEPAYILTVRGFGYRFAG